MTAHVRITTSRLGAAAGPGRGRWPVQGGGIRSEGGGRATKGGSVRGKGGGSLAGGGSDERGLTLLETLIILGVVTILLGALAPLLVNQLTQSRMTEVLDEMEGLHHGMLGVDEADTYGFVGDMGRLPNGVEELLVRGNQRPFTVSQSHGVGYGWNGPYVAGGVDAEGLATDPWGNAYDIGGRGPGQIWSAGPNGIFDDGDDVVYPATPVNIYGSLLVLVKGVVGNTVFTNPEGCIVTLFFSADGAESSVVDESAPFSFSSVHRGLHAVNVTCSAAEGGGTVTETSVVGVVGRGEQQMTEIFLRQGELLSIEGSSGSGGDEDGDGEDGDEEEG